MRHQKNAACAAIAKNVFAMTGKNIMSENAVLG